MLNYKQAFTKPSYFVHQQRNIGGLSMKNTRAAAFYHKLAEQGGGAYLVTAPSNIRYLSGYTGDEAYLLVSPGHNWLITDFRYTEQAEREVCDFEVKLHRNNAPTLPQLILEYCQNLGIDKLIFETEHITYALYAQIAAVLQDRVQMIPGGGLIEELRYCKSPEELDALRVACAATDRVFTKMCGFIRPGLTEKDLARELLYFIGEEHCDNSFPIIIASGVNGSLPHAVPSDKPVSKGELITMDFGCMYQGYHADMTRTVMLGQPAEWQKELYAIVLEANRRAEALVKAGVPGVEVDAAARDYITEQGYGERFGHGLGHGVGLDIHEKPFMSRTCEQILASGCVVTVEPGIYLPGQGGCRIEDSVLVTEGGAEILFTSTKEMVIIE